MREIKFRAKCLYNGEWVYGYYLEQTFCDGQGRGSYIKIDGYSPIKVYPETVGQFTGIKDKCGREIYEGDVVMVTMNIAHGKTIAQSVKVWFERSSFVCDWGNKGPQKLDAFSYNVDFEVIGNIHDNAELLAAGNENN